MDPAKKIVLEKVVVNVSSIISSSIISGDSMGLVSSDELKEKGGEYVLKKIYTNHPKCAESMPVLNKRNQRYNRKY